MAKLRVGILGASGYTGVELVRLLLGHPQVELTALTAEKNAGQPMAAVWPHLAGRGLPDLVALDAVDYGALDFVFCALPHGTTQEVIARLPERLRVVDLSADFRLTDVKSYAAWYGQEHRAPALQAGAVYGLTEFARETVRQARLVANPGCYPTASQIPLAPLLRAGVISADDIIIDAKSGISGAGRALKLGNLYCEVSEGMYAYGVGKHRHTPEIEQELGRAAGRDVRVNFTPHVVPMSRGMMASCYVRLAAGKSFEDVLACWQRAFAREKFVRVLSGDALPTTLGVRGTNCCQIAVVADRLPGRVILLSAIDNLMKGAAGQAVQNMNVMCGWDEATSLDAVALMP